MTSLFAFVANLFSNDQADQLEAATRAIKVALASGDRLALADAIEASGAVIRG